MQAMDKHCRVVNFRIYGLQKKFKEGLDIGLFSHIAIITGCD